MIELKLSEELRRWRSKRPDEEVMDKFIAIAEIIEGVKLSCVDQDLKAFTMAYTQGLLSNPNCYRHSVNGRIYFSGTTVSSIALNEAIATLEALEKVK